MGEEHREENVLDFKDLEDLLRLTAVRAKAVQETVGLLAQIFQGQEKQIAALERVREELSNLINCSRRVEGVATAMAAYMSSRDASDLGKLEKMLDSVGEERDCALPGGDVHVHVDVDQQAGGVRAGEIKAESDRDVNVAGGNIEEG